MQNLAKVFPGLSVVTTLCGSRDRDEVVKRDNRVITAFERMTVVSDAALRGRSLASNPDFDLYLEVGDIDSGQYETGNRHYDFKLES